MFIKRFLILFLPPTQMDEKIVEVDGVKVIFNAHVNIYFRFLFYALNSTLSLVINYSASYYIFKDFVYLTGNLVILFKLNIFKILYFSL